ncbi:MAG: ATP-dependent DNA ligase, partial [Bacteroidota bacterium]
MKKFAHLFTQLDQTTKTNLKVAALQHYFAQAEEKDKLWTIALLSHRRPKRTVNTTLLLTWAAKKSNVPLWLFEESYGVTGDLAETIALILPAATSESDNSLTYWIEYIRDLEGKDDSEKQAAIYAAWEQLDQTERFVFNKIITGNFRVGVSQKLMTRA